jgi:Domain of Unknown Function with PDB structure (DUF3857)/Transglutaminase-like superfamily
MWRFFFLMNTFLLILASQYGFSQQTNLDVKFIPDSLLKNAHSVMREETDNFELYDVDAAKLTVHQVVTVLDAEGKSELDFEIASSAFERLDDAEIKVFDAHGLPVNRYRLKEIGSESFGEGLVEDGKIYYFRVTAPSYPITVEYDYVIKYKGTLIYPEYQIQDPDQSVQFSQFVATVPSNLDLRFKSENIKLLPSINSSGDHKVFTWTIQNVRPIPDEEGAAKYDADYPQILLAPGKFSMDGYQGDLSSWKSFGEWYDNLAEGTDDLSEATKAGLQKMVAGIEDEKEKIKIIYQYLQHNFRYVSIQLGIGGFRPLNASFVDQKKYGDCKALCNYMQACLEAIGIPSRQALVNAEYNSQPVDPTFPMNGFNHVILCVPLKNDSVWLECTSNITEFAQLTSFTENRYALLITPDGGKLVRTPDSKSDENTFSCNTRVELNEDGSGSFKSRLKMSGEYREQLIHYVINEDKDEQKKFLVNYLGFIQPDDFDIQSVPGQDSTSVIFTASEEKIPEFMAGSKMFLNTRLYKIWRTDLPLDSERRMPFYFNCPFIRTDTTVYHLPAGYSPEDLPQPRDEQFKYGSYKTSYLYDEKSNTITTYATLILLKNVIPPGDFFSTVRFFSDVIDELTQKIVVSQK